MHKYQWLEKRLEGLIQHQIQEGKNKLPSEQELSRQYRISRQTVRMALNRLEEKGLIEKKRGSGSYITGRMAGFGENEIGILLADDQEYIYPGIIYDIKQTLSESGFSGTVFPTANCVDRERKILRDMLPHPPRGLIVEGCKSALPNPNLDLYRRLAGEGCRMVFLRGHYPELPGCPFIKDDNFSGSAMLVRHLASLGHKTIAGIFKSDDLQGVERYQGFVETLRDLDLPMADRQICWYASRDLDNLVSRKNTGFIREIIAETLPSCTAVVCHNDFLAYHLINALIQTGYSLPEDMAVTAFNNTYLSSSNALTASLSHQPHETGTRAAQAIIRKLKGLPVYSQEIRWQLNAKTGTAIG